MDLQLDLFDQLSLKKAEDDRYLAIKEEKYFYIGELLYVILSKVKEKMTIAEIQQALTVENNVELQEEELNSILQKSILQLNLDVTQDAEQADIIRNRSSYIFLQFELVNEVFLQKLASPLVFLFQKSIFVPILVLSFFSSIFYFMFSAKAMGSIALGWQELTTVYVVLGLIFMAHELGHAVACKKYDIAPKSIGFGFYLIFPAFFTDVSRVWSLGKRKRIVINLGGVYFQSIINVFLITAYYLLGSQNAGLQDIVQIIILTNTFVYLYSLVPFLRYDGYWIYSDYFEIPNLMQQSLKYPFKLIKERTLSNINIPLLVYSIINYSVFSYIMYSTSESVTKTIQAGQGMSIIAEGGGLSMIGIFFYAKVTFLTIIFGFMLRNLARAGKNFLTRI